MGKPFSEIELIPWIHNPNALVHEEVVNYISRLPKNSVVALEISPEQSVFVEKFRAILIGKKPSSMYGGLHEQTQSKVLSQILTTPNPSEHLKARLAEEMWALSEIVLACQKRNIQIVPIRPPTVEHIFEKMERLGIPDQVIFDLFPDHRFADHIRTVHVPSGRKLFVIAGAGHVPVLSHILHDHGFRVYVKTDIFRHPKLMINFMQAAFEAKNSFHSGANKSLDFWAEKMTEVLNDVTRVKRWSNRVPDQIVSALQERQRIREQRIQRKLRKPAKSLHSFRK